MFWGNIRHDVVSLDLLPSRGTSRFVFTFVELPEEFQRDTTIQDINMEASSSYDKASILILKRPDSLH